jgi:hypothetical protein
MRTNIVYHGDILAISAHRQVLNRNAYFYSNYYGNYYDELKIDPSKVSENYTIEVKHSKLWASVDDYAKWNINIYSSPYDNEQELEDYMHVGDVIALHLSERKLFLNTNRSYNLYDKIHCLLV